MTCKLIQRHRSLIGGKGLDPAFQLLCVCVTVLPTDPNLPCLNQVGVTSACEA